MAQRLYGIEIHHVSRVRFPKVDLTISSIIARSIKRRLHDRLSHLISRFRAVALLGPGQVGRTTLALAVAESLPSIYLDLESGADRAKLTVPKLYLTDHEDKLVILDEVHRLAGLFQSLRGRIGCRRPLTDLFDTILASSFDTP
jgi:predicted AAA+ superfamily ATPase